MKRMMLAVLSGIAALLMWAASTFASHPAAFPTTLVYAGPFAGQEFHGIMYGLIGSPKLECLPGRTVKLYVLQGGSLVLTDTDKTSNKGIWAANTPAFAEGKVTVSRKVIGRRGHRRICKGDSLVLD
jgi:hypothetical protein